MIVVISVILLAGGQCCCTSLFLFQVNSARRENKRENKIKRVILLVPSHQLKVLQTPHRGEKNWKKRCLSKDNEEKRGEEKNKWRHIVCVGVCPKLAGVCVCVLHVALCVFLCVSVSLCVCLCAYICVFLHPVSTAAKWGSNSYLNCEIPVLRQALV